MKKYNKLVLLFISIIPILLLNSCCDDKVCDCEYIAEYSCSPREVTLSEFVTKIDTTQTELIPADSSFLAAEGIIYYPVNNYYSQSFTFPASQYNSGLLGADESFRIEIGVDKKLIVKQKLNQFNIASDYYAAIMDSLPLNSEIKGDFVVKEINIDNINVLNSYAVIRVKGDMAYYADNFLSESSLDFCSYISSEFYNTNNEVNKAKILALRNQLSEYGSKLSQCTKIIYNANDIAVINTENRVLYNFANDKIRWEPFTGKKTIYEKFLEILPSIQNNKVNIAASLLKQSYNVYEIKIQLGEVYLYRSDAGRDFIMVMTNIEEREVPLSKSKKRMTIMYNEI